jgi:hypothetical protein
LRFNLRAHNVTLTAKELTDTLRHASTKLQASTLRVTTDDGGVSATLNLTRRALRVQNVGCECRWVHVVEAL